MKNFRRLVTQICRTSAGFTMIELLVVIAVIGVLAVAVLSAINPIEQINKGRDTGSRSDAGEIISAAERYFATQQVYPWNVANVANNFVVTNGCTGADGFSCSFSVTPLNTSAEWSWLFNLSDAQEVKPAFVSRLLSTKKITVIRPQGTNSSVYACFIPSSQSFKLEAAKNCFTDQGGNGSQAQFLDPNDINFQVCATTDGSVPVVAGQDNYICLP